MRGTFPASQCRLLCINTLPAESPNLSQKDIWPDAPQKVNFILRRESQVTIMICVLQEMVQRNPHVRRKRLYLCVMPFLEEWSDVCMILKLFEAWFVGTRHETVATMRFFAFATDISLIPLDSHTPLRESEIFGGERRLGFCVSRCRLQTRVGVPTGPQRMLTYRKLIESRADDLSFPFGKFRGNRELGHDFIRKWSIFSWGVVFASPEIEAN